MRRRYRRRRRNISAGKKAAIGAAGIGYGGLRTIWKLVKRYM